MLGSTLYAADQGSPGGGEVTVCAINSADGTPSGCFVTASASGLNYASGVTLGGFGYVETDNNGLFTRLRFDDRFADELCRGRDLGLRWRCLEHCHLERSRLCRQPSQAASPPVRSIAQEPFVVQQYRPGWLDWHWRRESMSTQGGCVASGWNFMGSTSDVYLCPISGLTVSVGVAVSDGSDSGFTFPTDVIIH